VLLAGVVGVVVLRLRRLGGVVFGRFTGAAADRCVLRVREGFDNGSQFVAKF
jgi:hypothetical protein